MFFKPAFSELQIPCSSLADSFSGVSCTGSALVGLLESVTTGGFITAGVVIVGGDKTVCALVVADAFCVVSLCVFSLCLVASDWASAWASVCSGVAAGFLLLSFCFVLACAVLPLLAVALLGAVLFGSILDERWSIDGRNGFSFIGRLLPPAQGES